MDVNGNQNRLIIQVCNNMRVSKSGQNTFFFFFGELSLTVSYGSLMCRDNYKIFEVHFLWRVNITLFV